MPSAHFQFQTKLAHQFGGWQFGLLQIGIIGDSRQGLCGVTAPEFQSYITLWQEQCVGASSKSRTFLIFLAPFDCRV